MPWEEQRAEAWMQQRGETECRSGSGWGQGMENTHCKLMKWTFILTFWSNTSNKAIQHLKYAAIKVRCFGTDLVSCVTLSFVNITQENRSVFTAT